MSLFAGEANKTSMQFHKISFLAFQLFSKYLAKQKLQIPDLLIAATALRFDLKLYTDNKKHYHFIGGLKLYK